MSIIAPIVTYEQGALKCWDRFTLLLWEHLGQRVIDKAKERDPDNVEVTQDDIKVCLREAVSEALEVFLQ